MIFKGPERQPIKTRLSSPVQIQQPIALHLKKQNCQEESLFFYCISIIDRVYAIFNKEHFNILC